ncbi:MAG TPA: response regulator [Polyangia bacterium]|jgi:DNA-binding NarL/FixJ family response regulator|nr:response regulator [Polyangia bacterium]
MTRILLVDDSEQVRRSIRSVLAELIAGATFREAGDAANALAEIAREPCDLVLLDLSLPDRSGFDTLRDIRRQWPALPVVVMSFNPEAEYAAATRAAGAAGYVAKGSSADAIAAVVSDALAPQRKK